MRFIGLVMVLAGAAVVYFLGYKGLTVDQARTRLAKLLNLPGLRTPAAASSTAPGSGSGFTGSTAVAGGGGGGGGGGSW